MKASGDRLGNGRQSGETGRPVRVLVNALHSKSGGGVTYLNNIIPALAADDGIELHLLLHSTQLDQYEALIDFARLHVFTFPESMVRTQIWEQVVLPLIVRIMGADVVYSPANYGPLLVRRSVVLVRNSLAVAMKEVRISKIAYWMAVASMTILSLLVARSAVAVSQYTVDSLIRWPFAGIRRKINVVNHGVSRLYNPGSGGARRSNTLLAVGDIYIQKNYHTLIDVFRRLLESHPDLVLSIAGRPVDRDYADSLNETIRRRGLEGKVTFLGHVPPENLCRLYRECRLFVFPSTVETFGNPLVEALACGAPVACSNRTAMPEIAGDAVEYFDPEDAQSMQAAIVRLLTDEARCAQLSKLALARARHFSWERSASEVAGILKQAAP